MRLLRKILVFCLLPLAFPASAATTASVSIEAGKTGTAVVKSDSSSSSRKVSKIIIGDSEIVTGVSGVAVGDSVSTFGSSVTITAGSKTGTTTIDFQYDKSNTFGGSTKTTFCTVTVTVTASPETVAFDGVKISYAGATSKIDGSDLVITFGQSGSLTLPQTFANSSLLVVGGGGSGGTGDTDYANKDGNKGMGNGGSSGTAVYKDGTVTLPATTYTITVGVGGKGNTTSSSKAKGVDGKDSSISGSGFTTVTGTKGAGAVEDKANLVNGSGSPLTCSITGKNVTYATPGKYASSRSATATAKGANTGDGGDGCGATKSIKGGDGGSGVVIVRLKPQKIRTPIDVPTATTAFTFDNTVKTCVATGTGYTCGGTYEATNAGDYTATVTPDDDHCWTGGSRESVEIKWTIARRPATVTVVNTNKVEGAVFTDPDQQEYNDPIWTTTTEGLIASDTTELTWDIFRTNACEEVGTYDLLVEGAAKQGNYELTFVGGKYEICEAPPQGPTISDDEGGLVYDPDLAEVVVTPNAGVSEVEIVNMPEDATATVPVTIDAVKGVEPTKIKVVHTTSDGTPYDITRAFAIAGDAASGVTIALDGAASVEIPLAGGGSETVTVEPRLTESGDKAIEPFEVDAGEVDVGVRTIPGLTYKLTRSTTVVTVSEGVVVDSKRAEATRTKLSDPFEGGRPNEAFYVIRVTK